ncbi:O-antigen ligase family protein [Acinetobacter sp. ANC 4862]|uniref:O-antigen ligase family protein n=1 Tax=Acinetobacter sp. ANC 4862 TaxID=2529849 RepID=UPI00104094E8|nr:O-antigen ligase family protein [Acinetobacter sp. ANC 4862]TCH64446.1 O-antigen ligase family protein [Acinetobacter sp. ANC 4862]
MFSSEIFKKKDTISILLNIIFFVFFYRATFAKSTIEGLSFFIALLALSFITFIFCKKNGYKPHIPKYSFFVFTTPTIIIFTQYFINKIPEKESISELTNHQIFYMYNINYIYSIVFILLPFILFNIKYKYSTFFNILGFSTLSYIIFNMYLMLYLNLERMELIDKINSIINYDNISIIISTLTFIYSFHLYKINKKYYGTFLFFISMFAIFINISHGTRGTWIAIPFIFFYTLWTYRKECKFYLSLFFGISLIAITYTYIKKGEVIDRISQAYNDLILIFNNSSQATSIGSRLEMWHLAINNFKDSPITGIGSFNVAKELCDLSHQGILAGECLTHMHNIYFQELASHGLIGFLALLFSFIFPAILFFKKIMYNNSEIQHFLSLAGLYTIFTVMICGLTDYYFITEISTSLYFILVLSLLTFISIENKCVKINSR